MTTVAFIDANIPLYSVGGPHLYQAPARTLLAFAAGHRSHFFSSAEVMQELLNVGVRRQDLVHAERSMGALSAACGAIEPLTADDVWTALTLDLPRLSARDRIHLAVMRRRDCTHIVTTDRAFEAVPGITRLDPLEFEQWREDLVRD